MTNLKTTNQPLDKLQADIDSFTNISDDLKLRNDTGKYVDALTSNIKDRLGSSPDVIEAFAIFDPLLLPNSDDDSFREYGESEVTILANHFFPGDEDKKRKLLCQWSRVKFFLSGKPFQAPSGTQSTTFFLSFLLKNKGIFHPSMIKRSCLWLKLGFHYHAAMPGVEEEEA